MQNKFAAIIFIILISSPFFSASGQKMINSPYARFNLGTLEPAGSFRSRAMGGTGTAIRDNSTLYYTNPASFSSIDTNSFVFDFGINYGINTLSDGSEKYSSDDVNFDHMLLGLPLAKGWGAGFGITSFSNGYYSIASKVGRNDSGYNPVTGEYAENHSGKGGISRLFAGTGVKMLRYFSAGVNVNILFGSIRRSNQFIFTDYFNSYNNDLTEKLELNGINFDYGLQAELPFKNNYFLIAGASLGQGMNYKSRYEVLSYRYNYYGLNDTINWSADSSKTFIPGTLSLGLSFGKKNKFTAAVDYVMTNWSESNLHGSRGYLADARSLSFGVEYIPEKYSNFSLFRRMEYRIGAHLDDNYLIINGEQLKEAGITAGIGIPMRRSLSKANIYFDFTKRSGKGGIMHTENIFTIGASLNLYDPYWFLKRKYD